MADQQEEFNIFLLSSIEMKHEVRTKTFQK